MMSGDQRRWIVNPLWDALMPPLAVVLPLWEQSYPPARTFVRPYQQGRAVLLFADGAAAAAIGRLGSSA
jgi:hypothetical protein